MRYSFVLLFCLLLHQATAQDKKYTIVFLNKNPDAPKLSKEESEKIMAGHMANMEKLAKEGKLLAAGPFETGGGIFIFNESTQEQIEQYTKSDPGVQAKRWKMEILPYQPRAGGICPVKEPYDMVLYTFVRFDAYIQKFTASDYPQIFAKHLEYMKKLQATGNVITHAVFGENEGGILVMKGDFQEDVAQLDPGVQAGLLEPKILKLYIAKGSFCER